MIRECRISAPCALIPGCSIFFGLCSHHRVQNFCSLCSDPSVQYFCGLCSDHRLQKFRSLCYDSRVQNFCGMCSYPSERRPVFWFKFKFWFEIHRKKAWFACTRVLVKWEFICSNHYVRCFNRLRSSALLFFRTLQEFNHCSGQSNGCNKKLCHIALLFMTALQENIRVLHIAEGIVSPRRSFSTKTWFSIS